ncbi:MAG TPA: hypothetical protein VHV32_19255 [Candidatus Angelobacter sp.]|jgi:hypothetical protein|nr:hypothetical protein [Candidatus Angelobacter sp.]
MDKLAKTQSATLEIRRKSYAESQAKTLAEMLYIVGQQYRKEITAEVTAFWKLSLIDRGRLSPEQIREGFNAHFSNPQKCDWPPQPGDIFGGVPEMPQPGNATLDEMRNLKAREAGGEKFYGKADLAADFLKQVENAAPKKSMPNVRTVFPDIDPNKNAEKLRQQAETLLKSQTKGD